MHFFFFATFNVRVFSSLFVSKILNIEYEIIYSYAINYISNIYEEETRLHGRSESIDFNNTNKNKSRKEEARTIFVMI